MLVIILVLLGLCAGSFVNAAVWRLHGQGKRQKLKNRSLSILHGRSMCPHCRHELAAADLIPIISWVALKGRCRYCKRPISIQYPLVELATAAVFSLSYVWWPVSLAGNGQRLLLATWLVCSVGLMALLAYDFKWLLLPNRFIYPSLAVALVGRLGYIIFFSNDIAHSFWLLAFGLLIASGF